MNSQYEVLSPWAEVDPIPLRGISPRVTDLAGKRIGLLVNGKRASRPIMTVLEQRLKERFPTSEFIYFGPTGNREVVGAPDQAFENWVKGVDTIITAIGD
jgi:hypothetical protein